MVKVNEQVGDIFASPEGSILIHSCNCQGAWGSGVAAAFRAKYPAAYKIYRSHCTEPDTVHHKKLLAGTVLLIPPQDEDVERGSGRHYIACLLVSVHFGRYADRPDTILENTRKSLAALRQKLQSIDASVEPGEPRLNEQGNLYAVRLNAKAFKTPWLMTKRLIEHSALPVTVMNNLDIMDGRELNQVIKEMEEWEEDPEGLSKWKEENE